MRNRYSATLVALIALVCLFLSATDVVATRKTAKLDGRVRSLSFSKSVPNRLNYQGYLVDATDSMAVTDTLVMTFRLYDAETGGLEQWAETHPEVPVMGGLFSVLLGDVSAFPGGLFQGFTLWLQTEIGAEVLSPRRPLVSVAYSLRAQEADHATLADSAVVSGPVDYYVDEADLDHLDAADGDPDSALCVDEDGNVGIGTISPAAQLDVRGTVNVGKDSSGYDVNFYGGEGYYGGARLFWHAYKMALRTGKDSDGTHWAPDSVGFFSLAAGIDTKARGYASIATGAHATASGEYSTAMGVHTKASGLYSTAMGYDSEASGDYSMARGAGAIASGRTSTSAGWYTTASGRNSIAMGVWTTAGPADYTMAFGRGTSPSDHLVNNVENSLIVGFNTTTPTLFVGGANHRVGVGTTSPSRKLWVNGDAGGATAWFNDSDERLKKNIGTIEDALSRVQKLRGVNFEWKDTENRPAGLQMGFIAQEAAGIIPEVVSHKGGHYAMQYGPVTALLVEALKEQQATIQKLEARIEALERAGSQK